MWGISILANFRPMGYNLSLFQSALGHSEGVGVKQIEEQK